MSHFSCVVIVSKKDMEIAGDNIDTVVEEALSPFDENVEVPAYSKKCYCIGAKARHDAGKAAEAQFPLDRLREVYAKENKAFLAANPDTPESPYFPDDDWWAAYPGPKWPDHLKPYIEVDLATFEAHPLKDTPNPDCGDCKGTGTRRTNYNPNSKWDWWHIGGRWSGDFQETSNILPAPSPTPETGEGWPNSDIVLVDDILASEKLYVPFAVVSPQLAWYEKGKVGLFGYVSNEKRGTDWQQDVREIYEAYKGHYAILCDLHI